VSSASQPYATTPAAGAPAAGGTTYATRTGVYPVGYRTIQAVWFVAGVINVILALDFVFRLASANNVGFAHLIYAIGRGLAAPFDGIFNNVVTDGQYVVKWSDLLAIAVYSLIAWGIAKLVRISSSRNSAPPA
jgi:hypothetical protein